MKTVQDLFNLDSMKDCTVLAGHSGLHRNIQFVNISDTPDAIQFVGPYYLLLTTAFGFKDNPEKLCELIQDMHDLNCSGMIIKIQRFLGSLPEEAKRLANKLAFPIINLPMEYTLGDVSRHILNYLNEDQSEQLHFAFQVHKKFSEMFVKGYDLESLILQFGYFIKRPVLLLNHQGEKLAFTHDFRQENVKQAEKEVLHLIKQSLITARQGRTFYVKSGGFESMSTFPIQTKNRHMSMLVIFDALTLPYPTSEIAIQQACQVISYKLINLQEILENAKRLKNKFFSDLIDKKLTSQEEILSKWTFYGLGANHTSICIVCRVDKHSFDEEVKNSIYDQIEDELMEGEWTGTGFTKENEIAIILQFPGYTKATIQQQAAKFIGHIQHVLGVEATFSCGVSHPIQSLTEVPTAFQESLEALSNGYAHGLTEFIEFYQTREVKELLSLLPKKNLRELYENTLRSLAYPKTKEDLELLKTIEVHLDSQCAISETSRKLYIHRNTVKYRIEKAEFLLNCSFQDPSDTLRIRVALLIGTIL